MICSQRQAAAFVAALLLGLAGAGPVNGQSGFGGPNILSRSSFYPGSPSLTPLKLRAFVSTTGFYTDGLTSQDQQGNLATTGSFGFGIGGGVYGVKITSRTHTTLGYSGSYNITNISGGVSYNSAVSRHNFNGMDQTLTFQHERQLTRRWGFFTGHSAGTQNSVLRARTLEQQGQFRSSFSDSYVNYFEPLDTRVYYLNSSAGFFFRRSRRLQFSFEGGVFTVHRQMTALASSRGGHAQGEISYQLSPRQTISLLYNFNHFHYQRAYGESQVHGVNIAYSRRLSRAWGLSLRAGPFQVESDRLQRVPVDPFIAWLTGQKTTIEAVHVVNHGLSVNGALNGSSRNHNHAFSVNYNRSVNPGNGLTLTALGETSGVNYGYSGIKNISFGAHSFYSSLSPVLYGLENQKRYGAWGFGGGATYRLTSSLFIISNAEVARVLYNGTNLNVIRKTVTLGLGFSPGELPLKWR